MNWKYYSPKFEYEKILQDTGFPWAGHKYFAYDLISNVKPQKIVELGTEYGTSLWSFSQAVKDQQIFAELDAIDTWTGDVHIGHYGEEVFKKVKEIQNKFYPELKINLIRETFDEALKFFGDNSIDILHIDGTHTYEAVKHDFENWFPKVKDGGIILFHDIVVIRDDFGVYKFWKELKDKYQTIEFCYSYGLGVLFKGDNELYTLKDELELHYSYLLEDIENKKFKEILKSPSEKDELIQLKNQNIELKNEEIQSKNREIENKNLMVQLKDQEIIKKELEIQSKNKEIENQSVEIQSKNKEIEYKNEHIESNIKEIEYMKSSKFWKIKTFYEKFKNPIFNLARLIKKSITILKEDGLLIFIHKIINKIKPALNKINQNIIKRKVSSNHHIKSVYYISNIATGGSNKYITDLINTFSMPHFNFVRIRYYSDLVFYKDLFKKDDIILFQYFFYTDFSFKHIIDIKNKYEMKLVIPIHDFYFLGKSNDDFYKPNSQVHTNYADHPSFLPQSFNLLKNADVIIYPSNFVKSIYDSIFIFPHAHLSRHIDYKILDYLKIPKVDDVINIGIINDLHFPKGASYYPKLFQIKEYRGYRIIYHIFGHTEISSENVVFHGPYKEEEIFSLLPKNEIHGLVFLNEYAETYSYSLTKGIDSGLPILYSKIGAYIERLKNNEKFFSLDNIKNIKSEMSKILDLILKKQDTSSDETVVQLEKDIPDFYQKLFSIDYDTILNNQYKQNKQSYKKLFNFVEPYAIYFPQFHEVEENNRTFYEGFTDMVNLQQVKKIDPSVETPLKDYLGYYNLKNDIGIIEKQILLAKANGFKGFGIYYFYFSHNTVTGDNRILMKDVVDRFFQKEIEDFDIFFIYANESWSHNPAFNQQENPYVVQSGYKKEEIIKNFENLLPYFKHKNYKKVDNKPVLFLHHPWEMTREEVDLLYTTGNEILKQNGFAGLEFAINGMKERYEGYKNYSHHADYKNASSFTTIEDGVRYIDYKKYVDNYLPRVPFRNNNIQTVFYNFDNTVRFFNHKNKQILITKTKNNNVEYFKKFLTSMLDTYNSPDKVGKIFLVNSWNEWGEQMALEPSNESGFNLLNAFNNVILKFLIKNEQELIESSFHANLLRSPAINENLGEKEISVILHLYYPDMWNEIKEKLKNIPYKYTLIISLTDGKYTDEDIKKIKEFNPEAKIASFPNQGLDILPFLKCLKLVPKTTKYVLKIHTKKSLYEKPEIGHEWFDNLIDHVLSDKKTVDLILKNLEYSCVGMIGGGSIPGGLKHLTGIISGNELIEPNIKLIYKYFNAENIDYKWIAGSMFWVRFDIINKFDDKFIDFVEKNQPLGYLKDTTLVHGLERYFGKLVYDAGKIILLVPIKK